MERKGVNNVELAKAVGLTHVSIGNFRAGQLPKANHLHALALFFNVTMEYLMTGETSLTSSAIHEDAPAYGDKQRIQRMEELRKRIEANLRELDGVLRSDHVKRGP